MTLKNKILLTCKEATLLTCKQQENAITFSEKIQLKMHLLVCKFCALFYKQSNHIHQHISKMHQQETNLPLLHLDETQKSALQEKLSKEL